MATLIVTPFTPREGSGRGLRTVGIARALARMETVEIASAAFDGGQPSPALRDDPNVTMRTLRASRGLRRAWAYARARAAGTPPGFARGVSDELVRAAAPASQFQRVVADGPTVAAALILVARQQGVVYNAHNLEFTFRTTLTSASRNYGSRDAVARFERTLLDGASETWLPTRRELAAATRLSAAAPLRYVPNVVDTVAITPVVPRTDSRRILFVADFTYGPNRNAAEGLVRDVMPQLWRRAPAARLTLVGRGLELPADTDGRIESLGFVDRLEDVYADATCAVVPLLEGGGSPLKLVEAMAYGLPVVATRVAASGLDEAVPSIHYLEGDTPPEIADALATALAGACEEIALSARQLAESRYSIEALVEHLR